MTSIEIISILKSIKDVRLNPSTNEVEVLFTDSKRYEGNNGYVYGSFTNELINLIEDSLRDELPTSDDYL